MVSTLCQKWLTIFCQKAQNFVRCIVRIILFCSNFTNMWSKYLSTNGETLDFQCQYQQMPDWKINFRSNFAVKTFPCYR